LWRRYAGAFVEGGDEEEDGVQFVDDEGDLDEISDYGGSIKEEQNFYSQEKAALPATIPSV
jgi:hypothetical protein